MLTCFDQLITKHNKKGDFGTKPKNYISLKDDCGNFTLKLISVISCCNQKLYVNNLGLSPIIPG